MREIWLPVADFEKFYDVSNLGRVRSKTVMRSHGGYRPRIILGRILSTKRTGQYHKVCLWGEDKTHVREVRVHVLVAEHFVPNPNDLPFVCHEDDDPENNKSSNLIWGSRQHNSNHAMANGLMGKVLTVAEVLKIKKALAVPGPVYGKYPPIAKRFGVSTTTIMRIAQGKIWAHAV